MMLAEMSGLEIGSVICAIIFGAATLILAIVSIFKKTEVKVEQPVSITITEELHKVFANREAFEKHIGENREDHDKIFSKIGGVERGAATSLEQKVETVRRDVVIVGNQVAALKSQTDLQNQQLARMDSKLDRLAERKNES
jgi:hypothetical protein